MQKAKHQILSTVALSKELIAEASVHEIAIDEIPFIEIKQIESESVINKIENYSHQIITAIFTSMNAVSAVVNRLKQKPPWKIYSISNATRNLIQDNFGKNSVAGTAGNAGKLAELIIHDKVKQAVFFCGNKRRDELPAMLKEHSIYVEEVIVYTTVEAPTVLSGKYAGILFFSPSAVHSFFSMNTVDEATQLFAIGSTTAKSIQQYSNNKVIVSHSPAKENLVKQMITYFSTIKKDQTVL